MAQRLLNPFSPTYSSRPLFALSESTMLIYPISPPASFTAKIIDTGTLCQSFVFLYSNASLNNSSEIIHYFLLILHFLDVSLFLSYHIIKRKYISISGFSCPFITCNDCDVICIYIFAYCMSLNKYFNTRAKN